MRVQGGGYAKRQAATERRIKNGEKIAGAHMLNCYNGMKEQRDLLLIALVAIYTKAQAAESGWTGPVYRDVLSSIQREARQAIERTE